MELHGPSSLSWYLNALSPLVSRARAKPRQKALFELCPSYSQYFDSRAVFRMDLGFYKRSVVMPLLQEVRLQDPVPLSVPRALTVAHVGPELYNRGPISIP